MGSGNLARQPAATDGARTIEEIARSAARTFQTVEQMAQSVVREAILRGLYPPGERLNLDSIAETLGVSRMPVRAGLRQLEAEGLVRIHPYRGVTVSVLRPSEIAEIYDLRILLEGYLLRRAVPRLNDDDIDRLEELVKVAEAAGDESARYESRMLFYNTLYGFADRPRAASMAAQLRGSVGRYLVIQQINEHSGHAGLVALLRRRDAIGARRWLTSHLTRLSKELQRLVAKG
jgi:DNA-binding GntR family transcriptional regulator